MDQNLLLLTLLAVMVGMMFLNGRKRKKQLQEMQDSLKVGSKVVLHSGIIGTVKKINSDSVVIETAGSGLEVMRQAIRSIDPVLASSATQAKAAGSTAAKATSAKTVSKVAAKPASKKTAAK